MKKRVCLCLLCMIPLLYIVEMLVLLYFLSCVIWNFEDTAGQVCKIEGIIMVLLIISITVLNIKMLRYAFDVFKNNTQIVKYNK